MIKVLVVEDSPTVRELLVHILGSDPDIQIIGTADSGETALQAIANEMPDVITMDIQMPDMNGLEATRRIMSTTPVPIVIVSAHWNPQEVATTFEAMEAGALAVLEKPQGIGHADYAAQSRKLIQTVKLMSEVRVVRRWSSSRLRPRTSPPVTAAPEVREQRSVRVVAIGASTGGPPVLQTVLAGLPAGFTAPVLIVQHIAAGFGEGLAQWLGQVTGLPVHVATHREALLPGHIYLAPDNRHLGISAQCRAVLSDDAPEHGLRPTVSHLFRSVAQACGRNAVGILLTGMGKDGAAELKEMKERGALTIAQDEATSVVYGMPGEAARLDAAKLILPPAEIAATLIRLLTPR
jgi:two-component system chemotaxis response regulator CheB